MAQPTFQVGGVCFQNHLSALLSDQWVLGASEGCHATPPRPCMPTSKLGCQHTPTPLGSQSIFCFCFFLTNASDLMLNLTSFLFSLLPNFQRTLFSSTGLHITCQSCKKADSLVPLPVWGSGRGKWKPALGRYEHGLARCAFSGRSVPGHRSQDTATFNKSASLF